MSVLRWVIADRFTGAVMAANEAHGSSESIEDVRMRVEQDPRLVFVALSSYDRLTPSMELISEGRAVPAEAAVVGLPDLGAIRYDVVTGWLAARPRPTWEESNGQTLQERAQALVAGGVAQGIATILATAEQADYDAHDPLEHVHRVTATEREIFDGSEAAIVAKRQRADGLRQQLGI